MPAVRAVLPVLALALALGVPMHAGAQSTTPPAPQVPADATLLSVATTAETTRVPDVARISTGVVTQAGDANAAMRENATQMDRVMAALRGAGIAARDIQTSGISLNPQYRYVENQPPAIVGYQASNTVSVKVRELARLGKVLDALAAAGANQISGPSFEVDQPEAAYAEARVLALRKAQAQAQTYAEALGLKVRRVISINEGGPRLPTPMPVLRAAAAPMAMMEKDTAVSPGEASLGVGIEVVFELGR